jgi:hypothetical protein
LTACNQKQKTEHYSRNSITFFDPIKFSAPYIKNTFKIEARFSECGEWGGHKEEIFIFADSSRIFYATYKVFPFNCDSLPYYDYKENLTPTINKTIVLNETTKKSIIDYILRLTQSKITERFPGQAGNFFSVANSDSTFYIQVYDSKEFDIESFRQLVMELLK